MTQNWPAQFEKHASQLDPDIRKKINEYLDNGMAVSVIALEIGVMVADVTAVYYADGHYMKGIE